jgi:hypothetical protein
MKLKQQYYKFKSFANVSTILKGMHNQALNLTVRLGGFFYRSSTNLNQIAILPKLRLSVSIRIKDI